MVFCVYKHHTRKMVKNCDRQYAFDWLRAVSCILVVILHVASMYLKEDFGYLISNMDYTIASFWRVLSQLAVPSFVMLSGAFVIKSENENFKFFYYKTWKRIILPTIVFSIIYVFMHYAEIFLALRFGIAVKAENTGFWKPVLDLLNGQPHVTMWYMYMLIPLYLITPVIVMIKKSLSINGYKKLAIIMMIYSVLVEKSCSLSWILQFVSWIGYFMLGDVIRECMGERRRNDVRGKNWNKIGGGIIIVAYFMLIIYWYIFTYRSGHLEIPKSFSWIVISLTIMQFIGISMISLNTSSNFMSITAKYSLEIYLIHPMLCEICMQLFGRIMKWFPAAWMIPVYALIIVCICIGVTVCVKHCIKKAYSP